MAMSPIRAMAPARMPHHMPLQKSRSAKRLLARMASASSSLDLHLDDAAAGAGAAAGGGAGAGVGSGGPHSPQVSPGPRSLSRRSKGDGPSVQPGSLRRQQSGGIVLVSSPGSPGNLLAKPARHSRSASAAAAVSGRGSKDQLHNRSQRERVFFPEASSRSLLTSSFYSAASAYGPSQGLSDYSSMTFMDVSTETDDAEDSSSKPKQALSHDSVPAQLYASAPSLVQRGTRRRGTTATEAHSRRASVGVTTRHGSRASLGSVGGEDGGWIGKHKFRPPPSPVKAKETATPTRTQMRQRREARARAVLRRKMTNVSALRLPLPSTASAAPVASPGAASTRSTASSASQRKQPRKKSKGLLRQLSSKSSPLTPPAELVKTVQCTCVHVCCAQAQHAAPRCKLTPPLLSLLSHRT